MDYKTGGISLTPKFKTLLFERFPRLAKWLGDENSFWPDAQLVQEKRAKHKLLQKMHSFWIKDVLEKSQATTPLNLQFSYAPQAVQEEKGTHRLRALRDQTKPLHDTEIVDVFESANGELLILGALGTGKTTLLLRLLRELLRRAETNEDSPVPVLFNLSSWTRKRQSIEEWMVSELHELYGIQMKLAKKWVQTDAVLPLFDGLNEVAAPWRASCVDEINSYREQHGTTETVVCVQAQAYNELNVRLKLHDAVSLQPLDVAQVDEALVRCGSSMDAARAALRADAAFQEFVRTPLTLGVLTATFGDQPLIGITSGSIEERRKRLFTAYIDRMLERSLRVGRRSRSKRTSFSKLQMKRWLGSLAQRLVDDRQSVLFVEHLQPHWLQTRRQEVAYRAGYFWLFSLVVSPCIALSTLPEVVNSKTPRGEVISSIGRSLLLGFELPLFLGAIMAFVVLLIKPAERAQTLEELQEARYGDDHSIKMVDSTDLSWRRLWELALFGLVLFASAALFLGVPVALFMEVLIRLGVLHFPARFGPHESWPLVLLNLASLGVVSGVMFGSGILARRPVRDSTYPNEGIWRSAKNAFQSSILIGLLVAFIVGLPALLLSDWVGAVLCALSITSMGIPLTMFALGGQACMQHLTLRLILSKIGILPWALVAFLDEAAERDILRKVGGGYTFVHPSLADYCATLSPGQAEEKSDVEKQ